MIRADVAIVGAGVAAAAAARVLAGRVDCVVVAPAPVERPRVGESLSPSARPLLQELGLWQGFVDQGHARCPTSFSAWGSGRLVESHRARPGWALDRDRFDAWLWRDVDVPCALTAVTHIERTDAGWVVHGRDGHRVVARWLIDASGRACVVGRRSAIRRRQTHGVALCAWLPQVDADVEPTRAVMVETVPQGWWYSTLTPTGHLVVALFTDSDLVPGRSGQHAWWRDQVRGAPLTRRRIESAGFALGPAPHSADASVQVLAQVTGPGWVATGDAAVAMDPLASHGITLALWSGLRAATGVVAALDGDLAPLDTYAATLTTGVSTTLRDLGRQYALERRFADQPYWRRRQGDRSSAASKASSRSTPSRN